MFKPAGKYTQSARFSTIFPEIKGISFARIINERVDKNNGVGAELEKLDQLTPIFKILEYICKKNNENYLKELIFDYEIERKFSKFRPHYKILEEKRNWVHIKLPNKAGIGGYLDTETQIFYLIFLTLPNDSLLI